jgi:hypothetical protein
MAMRERGPIERDRLRPRHVQFDGRGPVLTAHPDGSFTWVGEYVSVRVRRDGSVEIHRLGGGWSGSRYLARSGPIHLRDDDRSEERWFRDETQPLRSQLSMDDARRLADQSLDGLPGYLAARWGRALPASARRAELLELWNDAVEPDDPELGVAGAKARALVDRFVRSNLPPGSRDAFSPDEIAAFNARRGAKQPHFHPYDAPARSGPHDEAAE